MDVVRGYVFPALRILIWSLIAISLVWLAFVRSDPSNDADRAEPSADVTPPLFTVSRGDISNKVSLTGQVNADPAIEVRVTQAGEISKLFLTPGAAVAVGTPLAEVRYEREQTTAPPPSTDPDAPAPPVTPSYRYVTISSTAAGTLSTVPVLVKQVVAVGDVLAKVSPGTLSVSAPLTQGDQLRLLAAPTAATINVQGGPAPFACAGLTIGVPEDATETPPPAPDPYAPPVDPNTQPTGAIAKCGVPPGTTVFAGMAATIDIEAGVAAGVLVVPVTAVEGSVSTGNVWVVETAGAEPVPTQVTLGLTDGFMVEVQEGLTEGAQILEFVPNAEPPMGGPMGVEIGPGG
ncbi:MAG: hypothetical protein ACR2J5_16215 [Geodermatophilaceae bacterium]